MPLLRRHVSWIGISSICVLAGCGGHVSDPHDAAVAFARATRRGDAAALYAMLSPAAQRALLPADVQRLVKEESAELAAEGATLAAKDARVTARAELRFADGERAILDWSNGTFAVRAAGSLPGGGATPEAALDELRRAIARRSYPALVRILSPSTRSAVEQDLRTLVGGLEHPETLPIRTSGDSSTATVPGGHRVVLRRDRGIWRVEDFD